MQDVTDKIDNLVKIYEMRCQLETYFEVKTSFDNTFEMKWTDKLIISHFNE